MKGVAKFKPLKADIIITFAAWLAAVSACALVKGAAALLWYAPFAAFLGVLSVTDLRTGLIPHAVLLPMAAVGAALSVFSANIGPLDALLGGLVCGGALLAVTLIGALLTGTQGMGGGDIKLALCAGIFIGMRDGILGMMFAVFIAALYLLIKMAMKRPLKAGESLRFAPFLSLGWAVSALLGSGLVEWYTALIDCVVDAL